MVTGVLKFGPIIAKTLREIRPNACNRWRLDEMVVSVAGRQMYIWRAIDSEGEVLEILVQPPRDKAAADTTLSRHGYPRVWADFTPGPWTPVFFPSHRSGISAPPRALSSTIKA
ncbi:MAG: DDE-type integrase/transposase/recombinase [Methylocella sp.]